jgi:hypothetical protein
VGLCEDNFVLNERWDAPFYQRAHVKHAVRAARGREKAFAAASVEYVSVWCWSELSLSGEQGEIVGDDR